MEDYKSANEEVETKSSSNNEAWTFPRLYVNSGRYMGNNCCDGERSPPFTLPSGAKLEALATVAKDVEATLPLLQSDLKRINDALTAAERDESRSLLSAASTQADSVLEDAWDLLESAKASLVRSTLHLTLRQALPSVLPQSTESLATRLLSGQEAPDLPKYIRLATEGDEGKARKDVGRIRLKLDSAGVALRAALRALVQVEIHITQSKSRLSKDVLTQSKNIEKELREMQTSKGPALREAVLVDEEVAKFAQISKPSFLYEQVIILGKVLLDIQARADSLDQQLDSLQTEVSSRIEELKETETQVEVSVEDLSSTAFPNKFQPSATLSERSDSSRRHRESEEDFLQSISQIRRTLEEETRRSRNASEGLEELRDSLATSHSALQASKARVLLSLLKLREVRVSLQAVGRWKVQKMLGRQSEDEEEFMEERPRGMHSMDARESQVLLGRLSFQRGST